MEKISAYFYLTFEDNFNSSLQALLDSLNDDLTIRNIWNDGLHKPQVELEGSSNALKKWYSKMVVKKEVSEKEWKAWKDLNT